MANRITAQAQLVTCNRILEQPRIGFYVAVTTATICIRHLPFVCFVYKELRECSGR